MDYLVHNYFEMETKFISTLQKIVYLIYFFIWKYNNKYPNSFHVFQALHWANCLAFQTIYNI
jgi:hypothetical protein